jgi:tetratricopeptide (TPR) repeat protein
LSEAEALLEAALRRPGPHRVEALDSLIRLLRSEGRFSEARARFVASLPEAPDPVATLRRLNQLDLEPFPTEGVRVYLDRAGTQRPHDPRVWLGRAHLATRLGQLDEAKRWLDRCLATQPDDTAVWRARLEWALQAERVDVVFEALPHLPPDESEAARLRAWLARRRGAADDELRALDRLLELAPAETAALERRAEILASRPGSSEELSRIRRIRHEIEEARAVYRELLAGDNPRADASLLAQHTSKLGLGAEAATWATLAGEGPRPIPRAASSARTLADLVAVGPADADGNTADSSPAPREIVVPRFRDVAASGGLVFSFDNGSKSDRSRLIPPVTASGGVAVLDADNDGWLDVYCVQGGVFPPATPGARGGDRLFRNTRDGAFADITASAGIERLAQGYGHGVTVGDIDNDGYADLFLTRWRRYQLLRNRGDGTFENATAAWGLDGERDWPTSAAFADLDRDGDLDLYVCHYLEWDENGDRTCIDPDDPGRYNCAPLSFSSRPDHLFRNDGGRFTDVTAEAGIVDHDGRGLGVVACDLDDDGLVDLYVANDMTANFLFRNLGGMRFEEVGRQAGAAGSALGGYQAGMGVACGDLDGDERPDLAVTNFYNESTTFYHNLGGGLFADHTQDVGLAAPSRDLLGFGLSFLDVNNDSYLDILSINGHVHDGRPPFPWMMPAQLLLGDGTGRVRDVTGRCGPPLSTPRMGRGLAVADLGNDGRLSALVLSQNEPLACLEPQDIGGRFITFALEGTASGRDAVGARVMIESNGRRQTAWRLGGGSYQSAGDPRIHFGLGAAPDVDWVEVRWPSGHIDRHANPALNTGHLVREGSARLFPLPGFSNNSAAREAFP